MRSDYAGLRRLGFAREKAMMLLDAMARRTASALAGAIATTTAGAVAGTGTGTGTGTEDDRGLDGLTDSDDEDDGMDLGEDIDGVVTVTREQLLHALTEADRAYYPDTIPEELRDQYITIDQQGSKAVIFQHTTGNMAGVYEVSFRGTSVETIGTAGSNAITDLNSHVLSLDNGFVSEQMLLGKMIELEEKGVVTVGFAKHLDLIYDDVISNISDMENVDIVVNGHSLGAVTAQLFALRLLLTSGKRVNRVYSFGSPRGYDTFTSYVAQNLEVIQVMDERDPVTYMYPVFYEGHPGYKITQTEQGDIKTFGADELVPWHARNLEDSRRVYRNEQHDNKNGYFTTNWKEDVGVLNSVMTRTTTGFREFVMQFKDKLNREGATRFLSLSAQYGFKYHYQPNYYDMISKMSGSYTFQLPVSGLKRIDTLPTFVYEEPPDDVMHFTDYWSFIQDSGASSTPSVGNSGASYSGASNSGVSFNLADYVSPEMIASGFVLYDADDKTKIENNFVRW
jgi:hypothetical protein